MPEGALFYPSCDIVKQDWSPYKKLGFGHRLAHSGGHHAKVRIMPPQPRNYQKPGEKPGIHPSLVPSKGADPLILNF